MICIILVAGTENALERELLQDENLRGIPRALLPVRGKPMLDYWWDSVATTREILSIYLVCNAGNFKHFERWATAHGLPAQNVVNNGATSSMNALGASKDLHLGIRRAKADGMKVDQVLVIAGDALFFKEFDLPQVIGCFRKQKSQAKEEERENVNLVLYYKLNEGEDASKRGIVEIDPKTKKVLKFQEKPESTNSRLACPLFYIFGPQAISLLDEFNNDPEANKKNQKFSCGRFLAEVASKKSLLYGLRLPGGFNLVGVSAGLAEYHALNTSFGGDTGVMQHQHQHEILNSDSSTLITQSLFENEHPTPPVAVPSIRLSNPKRTYGSAYARVGILGNPSDGFFGKTLSATIKNFRAQVWLVESEKLCIRPHPLFDPNEFGSLSDLYAIARKEGYHGGTRVLLGTCKKFFEFALEHNIALPKKNFTVSYDTNIPRQVGLSGSSAIVTAFFRALMDFYGLTEDDIPKPLQPSFVLSVEIEELGIQAGLQDRVVQCYEGLVFMDFDKDLMDRDGHGWYEKLDTNLLPDSLFIVYRADPSDSGKIHSNVKQRWNEGDKEVIDAMAEFAGFAEKGKAALLEGNVEEFGSIIDQNFALRRKLYGDPVVGEANIKMIEIAKRHGARAKFPGSGGAILCMAKSKDDFPALRRDFETNGCVFCVLETTE